MSAEDVLTQERYNDLVYALDGAMLTMTQMGKTEDQARAWLKDFVLDHYLPVWRGIVSR